MNRSDHQVRAIAPRVLRALRPPSTARGRQRGGYQLLTEGPCPTKINKKRLDNLRPWDVFRDDPPEAPTQPHLKR
jgi:hypothetical protein